MQRYWEFKNGNKFSKHKYSYEDAKELNASLVNCANCIDCVNCTDCQNCKGCVDCKECVYCRFCTECENCAFCASCMFCYGCQHMAFENEKQGRKIRVMLQKALTKK